MVNHGGTGRIFSSRVLCLSRAYFGINPHGGVPLQIRAHHHGPMTDGRNGQDRIVGISLVAFQNIYVRCPQQEIVNTVYQPSCTGWPVTSQYMHSRAPFI